MVQWFSLAPNNEQRREISLQFGSDEELLRRSVILDLQNVWFAAHLAIFHVALAAAGSRVHGGGVPLAATCALEAGFHSTDYLARASVALLVVLLVVLPFVLRVRLSRHPLVRESQFRCDELELTIWL